MKTQLQFGSSACGRQYSKNLKREDTTSGEGTSLGFSNSVFGKQYSTIRERENTTSGGPLDNSCSEINVTGMTQITGKCSLEVEVLCSIVFITVVIESD